MSDEDLSRIPKESMQKLLNRCVEECPKFQKDYEKELKQTSRFLEVWQLSQFLLCLLFCKKDPLICLKGLSITPHWEGYCSPFFGFGPLKGFMGCNSALHWLYNLASYVVSGTTELQGNPWVCLPLGVEVSRQLNK